MRTKLEGIMGVCRRVGAVSALLAASTFANAETAKKVESCAEAQAALAANAAAPTARCWDFESGLGGWTVTGTAFDNQPTWGDNVSAQRIYQSGDVREQLDSIGGDYWRTPHPIGHQGNRWIGTYENRRTATEPWARTQGDAPTGTATSPAFTITRDFITFLIGGGAGSANVHIRLEVNDPFLGWVQAWDYPRNLPLKTTPQGASSELLVRQAWRTDDLSGLKGKEARIVIQDGATGSWGHINVDHILHTNTWPDDWAGANQPVWGFADAHAHPGNHLGFRNDDAGDGHLFHGSPGTSLDDDPHDHMPSCDGTGHGSNNHGPPQLIAKLEAASFGVAPAKSNWSGNYAERPAAFPGNNSYTGMHPAGGMQAAGPDLVAWPYWWTRAHQQMYVEWIRRSYDGGLRLMVASAGHAEMLAAFMRTQRMLGFRSDYAAMYLFADHMRRLADSNQDWMEIATSPRHAREIIRANKVAIVLGTEVEDIGDKCAGDFTSLYTEDRYNESVLDAFDYYHDANNFTARLDKNLVEARSCTTKSEWEARIDNLYSAGFRVLTPIHLTNNDLGGAAVYSDLFHPLQKFTRGEWFSAEPSSQVSFFLGSETKQYAWKRDALGPVNTSLFSDQLAPNPTVAGQGHINSVGLSDNGGFVLREMKKRGMVIDVAHMGLKTREKVLGLGTHALDSIVSPGCDVQSSAACRAKAYPVIASHAGFRDLAMDGKGTENDLSWQQIGQIKLIGGTVAVGTSSADVRHVNETPFGGTAWSGVYVQNVANDCAGSSRSWVQSYVYALRVMGPAGVTLGTDINGLEHQLNPRFGTTACYARGNVPRAVFRAYDGTTLIDFASHVPFNYNKQLIHFEMSNPGLNAGSAGAQALRQRSQPGLNYAHYAGTAPRAGSVYYSGLKLPDGFAIQMHNQNFAHASTAGFGSFTSTSMDALSSLPAINASRTGTRTFDLNYDGLAHYGMLPDLLQDARTVGVSREQLGPLFQSAESFIRTWEKACSLTDPNDLEAAPSRGCS
jgi:microsomal dipeptidase-like Zn-dependent dipeptidase